MIRSKSIEILKTFSKEELKQFGEFLHSPFHNKNKNLIKLFDVLERYHPEYNIENEKIYAEVYPGKTYNHNNMKKLMSEKFFILENFLIQLRMDNERFISDNYILEEYMFRKLNDLFLFKIKKIDEKMDEVNYYSYNFYDKAHLEDLIFEFYSRNNMENKTRLDTLLSRSEYSLYCFLENTLSDIENIRRLRTDFNQLQENIIIEWFIKSFDIKIFLKYLSENNIKNNLILFQISLILMNLYPEEESHFKNAKAYMVDLHKFFRGDYKKLIQYLIAMENYCLLKGNNGETKYDRDLFEIHKSHLKILLSCHEKILSNFYLNLIKNGIALNELEWVENLIKDKTKYLEEHDREHTYNYAKALFKFAKQKYEECLKYLSKLPIRTSYYKKMEISILILKCYYELSLYDAGFSLIDSSKHYLSKTDELNVNVKEYFNGNLAIIYKLFKLKINSCKVLKTDLLILKSEIVNNKGIRMTQQWSLQKIEELEKYISEKSLNKKTQRKQLNQTA